MKTKYIFVFIFAIVLLQSCKKKAGTVSYKIKFTTDQISHKKETVTDSLYAQFGPYITSITPTNLSARIWTIGYIDAVLNFSNNNANMLQYIEQNADKLPDRKSTRLNSSHIPLSRMPSSA